MGGDSSEGQEMSDKGTTKSRLTLPGSLDEKVPAFFRESGIPGAAVALVGPGGIEKSWFLGHACVEKRTPITGKTVFRLASISKMFTTLLILQEYEKGKFDLDDPVNQYLPSGKVIVKKGWPEVTFRHLLTHRSGIGELPRKCDILRPGFGMMVIGKNAKVPPLASIHSKDVKPEVKPGSKFAYSNFGFSLLGYLVECFNDGMDFRDIVQERILDRLGMKSSAFRRTVAIAANEATGYKKVLGTYREARYYQNIITPAGSLYSCIDDMALFARCLMRGGKPLVSRKTLEMAWTPQHWSHPAIKKFVSLGLCFYLYNAGGHRVVGHSGSTSGFTSAFSLLPDDDLAILVFGNLDEIFSASKTVPLKNKILQEILGIHGDHPGDENSSRKTLCAIKATVNNSGASGDGTSSLHLRDLAGYYGPLPGILTNTRVLLSAGDYKVSVKEIRGKPTLVLTSLYGGLRKGVELRPTNDPLVFTYPTRPGAAHERFSVVAFSSNKGHAKSLMRDENTAMNETMRDFPQVPGNQDVKKGSFEPVAMHLGLFSFRKQPLVKTLRFKFYLAAILALTLVLTISFYLLHAALTG